MLIENNVIPATKVVAYAMKTGIHKKFNWIPTFVGMTMKSEIQHHIMKINTTF